MNTKNKKLNNLINQIKKKKNIFYDEFLWLIKKENLNSIKEYFNDLVDLNVLEYNGVFTRLKRNVLLFNNLSLFSVEPSLNEENKIVYEGFLDKDSIINNSDYFKKTENVKSLAISLANRNINEIMEITKVLNLDNSHLAILFEYILGTSLVITIDDVLLVNKDINLNEQFVYNMCVYQEIPEKMKESILDFLINDEKDLYICLIRNKKNHSFFKKIVRTTELNNKINICGKYTYSPLLMACQEGHLDIVQYLLTSPELTGHADINIKDEDGWSALSLAVFYGHLNIVKYLLASPELKEHADINTKDAYGWNVLNLAIYNGISEIVEYLIQNPKLKIDKNKIDPIFLSCQEGHLEILQCLLNNSKLQENLIIDCKYINSLLFKASENGCLDIVKYLLTSSELKEHTDIHHKNIDGKNALMYACRYGHLDIVKYLLSSPELKKHVDIHHKDINGWNALMYACSNGNLGIVKYLLTSPKLNEYTDINNKDNDGRNALIFACSNGNLDIVKYLLTSPELKTHADIHHKDNSGMNALMWACRAGHLDIVKYLLTSPELTEHNDISSEDNNGQNALLLASENGHLNIIQYLLTSSDLKDHADINHKDNNGNSILSVNMRRSNLEIVKYLLGNSELDINQKNDQGYNLLEKYTHNSLFGVKKELIEYFLSFTELIDTLNIRNLNVSSLLSIEDAEKITMELLKKLKVNNNLELDYFVNKIRENENSNNYNELNKYIESLNIKFRGKNLYNYLYKLSQLYCPSVFAEKFVNLKIKENILNHNIQNLKIEYFQIILKYLDENTLLNLYQKLVTLYTENNNEYSFLLDYVIVLNELLENEVKSDYIYEYILNTYQSEEHFSFYLEKLAKLMLETNISISKEQRESIMRNKDISHIFYNYILNLSLEHELHINEQIKKIVKI